MHSKFHQFVVPLVVLASACSCTNADTSAVGNSVNLSLSGSESTLIATGAGKHRIRVELTETIPGALTLIAELRQPGVATVLATGRVVAPQKSEKQVVELPIDVPALGFYELTVRAVGANQQELASQKTTFASVPQRTQVGPSDFGVCTHFGQNKGVLPKSLDLIKLAGFSRIRDEMYWANIETTPGAFAFPTQYDNYINAAADKGLSPLIVLSYGNAKAYPQQFQDSIFPNTPEETQLFARYAAQCVQRYGKKVHDWELWNEPHSWGKVSPAVYTDLLKAVYPAVKAVDKKANLISCGGGGAGGGPGGDYITGVLKAGGLDDQDGFSIHPYMAPHPPDMGYAAPTSPLPGGRVSIASVSLHQADFIQNNPRTDGAKLGLWVTEMGWPTPTNGTSELMQAAYVTRTFLLWRRYHAAQAVFLYDFQNDGTNADDKEHNFGFIRQDFSPKPSYVSMAVLSSTLGNRPWTKSLIDTDEVKVQQYGAGKEAIIAAWTDTQGGGNTPALPDATTPSTFPLPTGRYIVRDWQGQERRVESQNDTLELALTAQPQFILKG